MKNIFCLFVVLLLLQTSVFAQTKKAVLEAPPVSVQDEYSSDAPVKHVPSVPSAVQPKSPLALSGTYEIGVGKTYVKLSDAVNDLVLQGVSGPVTFEFTDANYTDTSIVINAFAGQGAANPVVFQLKSGNPSAKILFTGGITTRTWGIRFDSTEYVSFVGSTTVGNRPITFEVDTTVGNPTRNVFQIIRSNNIKLEGLELIGHRRYSDATAATILTQTSFLGSTTVNSNNAYKNLLLKRGSIGVSLVGISNVLRDNNIMVSDCDFGGSSYIENYATRGFQLLWVDNLTITKNNIRRGKNFPAATSGPVGIISFGGHDNLVISHNQIHDLEKYGSTGGSASGIRMQTNGPGINSNVKILNNMVYDLRNSTGVNASAVQGVEGIAITSQASPNTFNTTEVYNNTVHLTGALNTATPSYTAAILISSVVATDLVMAKNNIVSNATITGGSNSGGYCYADFHNNPTVSGKLKADHNLYWYPHLPLYWSALSIFAGGNLADWNALTTEDANSIEQTNPFFVSATDPHITPGSLSAAEGNALVLALVTDDIDGDPRSGSAPDIGADEFSGNMYSFALQALIQGFYTDGIAKNNLYGSMVSDTVTVEIRNASSPYALVTSATAVLDTSGFGVFQMGSWTPGNSYYIVVKHRNLVETWSRAGGEVFSLTAAQYSFVDTAKAYGDNQVKIGEYWCMYNGDVNQDGTVDLGDLIEIDNDNANFVTGYVPTDVDGNNNIDLSDMIIADNNNAAFVGKITP